MIPVPPRASPGGPHLRVHRLALISSGLISRLWWCCRCGGSCDCPCRWHCCLRALVHTDRDYAAGALCLHLGGLSEKAIIKHIKAQSSALALSGIYVLVLRSSSRSACKLAHRPASSPRRVCAARQRAAGCRRVKHCYTPSRGVCSLWLYHTTVAVHICIELLPTPL